LSDKLYLYVFENKFSGRVVKKKAVLVILCVSLVFPVKSQVADSLFNGLTQFFYGNGQVSSEGFMRDGKPDGLWTTYHVNGKIKSVGLRNNFLLDSIWNFYDESGHLVESISYLRGNKSGYHYKYQKIAGEDSMIYVLKSRELFLENRKEGVGYYYDEQGNIELVVRYKSGKRQGLTREFNSDSVIQVVYKYHNDFMIDREFINQTDRRGLKQGLWREYYDNDNIKTERSYRDNVLNGYFREYDEKGRVIVSRYYSNGQEIEKDPEREIKIEIVNEYDDDGNIIVSGGFIEGVPVGVHREYTEEKSVVKTQEFSESGHLVSQGIMDEKGQLNEYWKFYFPNGEVQSEGNFNESKRTGVWKFYYPDGKLEQTGSYYDGKTDGLWTWYYSDGTVLREENYYRGFEDGMFTEYDRQGNIIAKGEYIEGNKEGEWYYKVGDQVEKGKYSYDLKDGVWTHYYLDGTRKFMGNYIQGSEDGRHRFYYEDGKLQEEQYWNMGLKTRTWRKFDREGNILISLTYENDVLTKIDGVNVNLEK